MSRTGGCLCGAVRFTATELGNFGVCHCKMCQRWAGGPFFGITVLEAAMRITGGENVIDFRSSDRATRSHCGVCGSSLWYRDDKGLEGTGDYEITIGLLDDADGLILRREVYIDRKPDSFALAGEHERLTEAEFMARKAANTEGTNP